MMIKGKTRRFLVACAGAVMRNLIEGAALINASLLITIPAISS